MDKRGNGVKRKQTREEMDQVETDQKGNGPRGNRPERKWAKRKQAREEMDQIETDQRGNRPELQVKRSEETDGDCPGTMIGPNNSKSKKAGCQRVPGN